MKKTFTLLSVISATLFNFAFGQTSIYKQNFDAATTFPTGWNATASSWYVDSTNNSTGYTGASGVNNVVIENKSATSGFDTLYSSSVSTVGYSDISVIWAARNTNHFSDSGSAIIGFYWSTDGGATWNNIAYTENATNSTWAIDNNATPIALPAGAANAASLQFALVAKIVTAPSGTYRIDDFNVSGTPATGINELSKNGFKVFSTNASSIQIVADRALSENMNVAVFDVNGKVVANGLMASPNYTISASSFGAGIYFVRLGNDKQSFVTKVFVR